MPKGEMTLDVKVKRLRPDAILPAYATEGSAAMDLYACLLERVEIGPSCIDRVPTGLAFEIPVGFEGQVRPRSSYACNGLTIANSPGTLDSDYRGELFILLHNVWPSGPPQIIRHGDRIAQLVIAPVVRASLIEVESLSETERGAGGFGSTGR